MYILNKSSVIKTLIPFYKEGKFSVFYFIYYLAMLSLLVYITNFSSIKSSLTIILIYCSIIVNSILSNSIVQVYSYFKGDDKKYDDILEFKKMCGDFFKKIYYTTITLSIIGLLLSLFFLVYIDINYNGEIVEYIIPSIMFLNYTMVIYFVYNNYKHIMS